jgi:hypothetical protein
MAKEILARDSSNGEGNVSHGFLFTFQIVKEMLKKFPLSITELMVKELLARFSSPLTQW